MQSYFTMVPTEKKCPLCGEDLFLLVCYCGDFEVIDKSKVSECFLLEPDEKICDLSCYFECRQKDIVIDLVDDIEEVDYLPCCHNGKRNDTDKLSVIRNLMQLGYKITPVKSQVPEDKIFDIRTNNKQLKPNHFVLLNEEK